LITIYNLKDDGTLENFGGRYDAASGLVFFYTGHFSKYVAAPAKPKYFKDMKGFDWAKNALYEMSAKNFINGTGIDTFSPGANLSRAEVSAILVRMLKYQANEESIPFKDLNAGKWYCKEVKAAYDNGLINGKGADRFDPDRSAAARVHEDSVHVLVSARRGGPENEAGGLGDSVFGDNGVRERDGMGVAESAALVLGSVRVGIGGTGAAHAGAAQLRPRRVPHHVRGAG
jgi:hypothetical protein